MHVEESKKAKQELKSEQSINKLYKLEINIHVRWHELQQDWRVEEKTEEKDINFPR